MWTIGEMSRITGVKYENVKYYCKPRRQNEKGREVGGAGLLEPAEVRGRTNYYDQEALFRLAAIDLMSKCGLSVEGMRSLLRGRRGVEGVIDAQVARLEKKLDEVRREMRTARFLSRALAALREDDDDAFDVIVDDCCQTALLEKAAALECDAMSHGQAALNPWETAWAERMTTLYKKKTSLENKGAPTVEINEAVRELDAGFQELMEREEEKNAGVSYLALDELWEMGKSPDCKEAAECLDLAYRSMLAVCGGLDVGAFRQMMGALLSGNVCALLMEVGMGEGWTRYVLKALDAYCESRGHGDEGLIRQGERSDG